ncbi:MAG: MalY/PatB family protein [Candidatus Promineifilaceae bacterium]
MTFNFDQPIDRSNTHSAKHHLISRNGVYTQSNAADRTNGADRTLQMWVADMDFETVPEIAEALHKRIDHQIYGYTLPHDGYHDAVMSWYKKHYDWQVEKEWILHTPGVVAALNAAVRCLTERDDKVLIQSPVYHPFKHAIENNGRTVETNPLILDEATGRYMMDFEDLARKTAQPDVTLVLFCSPHNPVSRVWTPEELMRFAQICNENSVTILADELHCDLIFSHAKFVPLVTLSDEVANNTITCMAPSKTFNLAGLKTSQITISNPELRAIFDAELTRTVLGKPKMFGLITTEAAYTHGQEWLDQVMAYIEANFYYMRDRFAEGLPQLKVTPADGTYLMWLDFRAFGLSQAELIDKLLDEAKVHMSSGAQFGTEGEGFMRINIATARVELEEAVERIIRTFA